MTYCIFVRWLSGIGSYLWRQKEMVFLHSIKKICENKLKWDLIKLSNGNVEMTEGVSIDNTSIIEE